MKQKRVSRGRKRGHLWLDWVELGCLGWEIDGSGAEASHLGCCEENDLCHLDRTTLHLFLGGCREFVAARTNDLLAAGYICIRREFTDAVEQRGVDKAIGRMWHLITPTVLTGNAVGDDVLKTLEWKVSAAAAMTPQEFEAEYGAEWKHPEGGVIRLSYKKPEGWFRRLWTAQVAAIVPRWEAILDAARNLRKVA